MSSRRSPSPRSSRQPYNDNRRGNPGKTRERDSGWAGRRTKEAENTEEPSSRHTGGRSRSGEENYTRDEPHSRSKYPSDRSRTDKEKYKSRSGSPARKRRRSGSRDDGYASGSKRRRDYDDHRERDREKDRRGERDERYRDHREGKQEESNALIRSGDGDVERRSRSANSEERKAEERRKPNYGNSGLLAAATNTVQRADGSATVLKYNEPPEARKPLEHWRLYEFKDDENTSMLAIYRQSAYTFGRDAAVVDIPIDHPSCSKQHAALQYRHVVEKNEFGEKKGIIKPFIIDLESTNGTHVNGVTIPPARYYELKLNDLIKFGTSSREFVLLHEGVA